jgi:hypothetical protein
MIEKKLLQEKTPELLLPRGNNVIVMDNFLFRRSLRFEEFFCKNHYRLTTQIQIKPLAFLGEYISTFVTTGLYSGESLEDELGWFVHRSAPHYLKLRSA